MSSLIERSAVCALLLATQAACTTIVLDENSSHEIVSVGITRILVPETQGGLVAFKRTGIGLGYGAAVGNAGWLGFDQSEWVIADPAECQLLIIIRSDAEARQASKILEQLEGENVCYANDTQR